MCRVELVYMYTNVFDCRRDVSACRKYSASSGDNFKRFKILVRLFISYACRADVVEVSHKLVQTSCICRHFSSLLAVQKIALPGTTLSTSFGDMRTTSARHAYDVCVTCSRDATSNRDKQQHLYDFVRVMFDSLTTLPRVLASCFVLP